MLFLKHQKDPYKMLEFPGFIRVVLPVINRDEVFADSYPKILYLSYPMDLPKIMIRKTHQIELRNEQHQKKGWF